MRRAQLARHLCDALRSDGHGRLVQGAYTAHYHINPCIAAANARPASVHSRPYTLDHRLDRTRHARSATCIAVSRSLASSAADVLPGREDRFEGIIISGEELPQDPAEFANRLEYSLKEWKRKGKRGIWLKLTTSQSALVAPATAAGLDFRHAEQGSVTLTTWLPDEPDLLPDGPTHQVGVGAFVLNSKQEMLLVQERHGLLDGKKFWKMPTGLTNLGEDITAAAEREVFEETGVRAAFDRVLSIRQSHGHNFGRSDLFFVCAMRLESDEQEFVLQQEEVVAAGWHSLAEVEQFPVFAGPVLSSMFASCKAYAEGRFSGISAEKLANGFNARSSLVLQV